jgi:transposase-like protein
LEAELTVPNQGNDTVVRHRLTRDQQSEIAQQYAEGATTVADIARQFDISEVSVYRTLRNQGVSLRGRASSGSAGARGNAASGAAPRRAAARNGASTGRRSRQSGAAASRAVGATAQTQTQTQFAVQFRAEQVVQAASIRDALRQVEALGATDVLEITQDR